MKKIIFVILLFFFTFSCIKNADLIDVFGELELSPKEIIADGKTEISISVEVKESSEDRRNIIFTTSGGKFKTTGTNKQTVKAEYENGILKATTSLLAPINPTTLIVTAQPEFDSPVKDFIIKDSIVVLSSQPDTIFVIPSNSGLASNHLNEVFLTGFLRNKYGNFVSSNVSVLFEDELMNGVKAEGNFRNLLSTTTDSSKVSSYYSARAYPIGTKIKIRCTIKDNNGLLTNKKDSVLLTINQ